MHSRIVLTKRRAFVMFSYHLTQAEGGNMVAYRLSSHQEGLNGRGEKFIARAVYVPAGKIFLQYPVMVCSIQTGLSRSLYKKYRDQASLVRHVSVESFDNKKVALAIAKELGVSSDIIDIRSATPLPA